MSNKSRDQLAETYKKTAARLNKIQSHLLTAPRSQRLKDKVCIITGVGSLKGIGRASAFLYAHEGARHLYLLDFIDTNLAELKSSIHARYPDVKVTMQQADAASEPAVESICKQALEEEGRLDVFFCQCWRGGHRGSTRDSSRSLHGRHQDQHTLGFSRFEACI